MNPARPVSFEVRSDRREVVIDGAVTPIGARAFDVLARLDAHADRVVTKPEFLEQVWGGRFISVKDCQHVVPDARALLQSGSNDALTLTYAGHALAYLARGAEIGLPALRKARALNPNSVTVLCSWGWLHTYVGGRPGGGRPADGRGTGRDPTRIDRDRNARGQPLQA
ncbi:hypothetical protein HKCCSP123_08720 [Rhodobacterales bacterium HKCCSP123]|nr:hypothetical protein [Rhodobacterales bacterium HKCCSP123]